VEPILTEIQKQRLTAIFESGVESASVALSRWLNQPVRLTVSEVDEVDLAEATELLGPAEDLVAACTMELLGRLDGLILMVFEDRAGLALADLLLNEPLGHATRWGELEQSAACETANIVGCAYLNAIAAHLTEALGHEEPLTPSPPTFRHEFAGSLLEFALMEQAIDLDRLILVKTQFATDQAALRWSLLFVPSGTSLGLLSSALS
jgi:chemotaxis protein CheC